LFLLCFFYFYNIFVFNYFSKTEHQTKTKIRVEDDPYPEGTEAKFQQDSLRDFGERGIYNADIG